MRELKRAFSSGAMANGDRAGRRKPGARGHVVVGVVRSHTVVSGNCCSCFMGWCR